MSWNGTERRAHKRYALPDATVRFGKAGVLSFFSPMSQPGLLLNLSARGVAFMSQQPFTEGETIRLKAEAAARGEPFGCKARVVWVQKSENGEAWRVGACIDAIAEPDSARLRHFLDKCVLEKSEISTSLFLKKVKRL